jgi:hypothetical protein
MAAPSKPIAGVAVANRQREKDETHCQHYEVEHGALPCKPNFPLGHEMDGLAGRIDVHQTLLNIFAVSCGRLRGTQRHKISRWKRSPRYRNLIKMRRHDLSMTRFIFGNNNLE